MKLSRQLIRDRRKRTKAVLFLCVCVAWAYIGSHYGNVDVDIVLPLLLLSFALPLSGFVLRRVPPGLKCAAGRRMAWLVRFRRAVHIRVIRGSDLPEFNGERFACLNCHTVFAGNYCPLCGQSRSVAGRFSARNFFKHVLVSLFRIANGFVRTIVDLLYRPGYMILGYLRGKRISYVAPFQMFLVVYMLFTIAEHTVFAGYVEGEKAAQEQADMAEADGGDDIIDKVLMYEMDMAKTAVKHIDEGTGQSKLIYGSWSMLKGWGEKNSDLLVETLGLIVLFSLFFWLFLRRCYASGGRLNLTEFVVVHTYSAVLLYIVDVLSYTLFGKTGENFLLVYVIVYRQIFGFSWFKSIWIVCAIFAVAFVVMLVAMIVLPAVVMKVNGML